MGEGTLELMGPVPESSNDACKKPIERRESDMTRGDSIPRTSAFSRRFSELLRSSNAALNRTNA